MLNKILSGALTILLATSLYSCGGGSELETPNTSGNTENDGLISQRNFTIIFSDVAPAFFDLSTTPAGITEVTSDVTVRIADNNNQVITVPKTIFFETEWGVIQPSCETDSDGSCTVTWRSGDPNDTALVGFQNTIVAYSSKSGETGQESFFDANDNGSFNDGETASDLDEPFIDNDESGTFTAGDKVIDTINGVDTTGVNGLHDAGDGFYNGPNCSHSSLCSPTRAVSTVWKSGSLQLTGTTQFTVGGNITGTGGNDTILQNNLGDNLLVNTDGGFTFPTSLTPGQTYSITVLTPPAGLTCTVTGGTGTVISSNITSVSINCT